MTGWLGKQAVNGRLAGMALLALLLTLRVLDPVWVTELRNTAFDTYQRLMPRPATPQPVVILDIDDASLAEIGQWPWPRTVPGQQQTTTAGAPARDSHSRQS